MSPVRASGRSTAASRRLSHSLVAICHPANDHERRRNDNAGTNRLHNRVRQRPGQWARDFYTNVLGFEQRVDNPTPDGPRFLTVAVKGQDFQLVLWPGTPGQAQPVQGRIPAAYTIETGDCRKAFEALKSRGVEFETGVLEYPWGYVAVFQDPDGNRLQLREGR
jgi:predicted enzyme related to lactoylglutathione lyase